MYKKRKAPLMTRSDGAIGKIIREQYSTLTRKEQEQSDKDFVHDAIGSLFVLAGLCALVVLMLIVG